MSEKAVVRKRVKSINSSVRSGYSQSVRRWGYTTQIILKHGERMADRLAFTFVEVKKELESQVPGIVFNPPEIFPVTKDQVIVLITGWKPEKIFIV